MMEFRTLLCLVMLSSCLAANFVMFPMFGRSHYMFVARLGQELTERGHQVKIFVGATQSYAANDSNVRVFKDDKFAAIYRQIRASSGPSGMKTAGVTDLLRILPKIQSVYCDEMLNDSELIREISHADAVVGELIYLCSSLVADKLSLPHVLISASTLSSPTAVALGLPSPPSYVPQWGTSLTHELKFVDRMKNVLQWMLTYYFYIYDFCPLFNEVKTRHNITPDKPIQETLGRVDMIIGQMDFTLEYPRPLLPNTKVVGPFLPSPAKPLPSDLDQFVKETGGDGVILVSFGTVLEGMKEASLQMMAKAFSKLPQTIIWKLNLEDTSKVSVSDNVKLLSWLPQNDILGHPKTRLFIGHAGLNGILESTYHGVPMICSPFFGDQFDNARIAKHAGFGEVMDVDTMSADEFINLIRKVLTQPRYRESAERISRSIKRLPRPPIKEAADWVEYTQAQGGLQ
ncbi:UDP-glucuronosyltransferase 2B33-like [Orbicella faveolata]|uniref:UDP-glucuronosyltransferase 2B33-like n=1 Tax=Orbicella faveolata TaxID=48498 RepID=UPI0009E4D507|nr:UDP-glucuronosyltransferase 2B33-like [Orbicella faveolata]